MGNIDALTDGISAVARAKSWHTPPDETAFAVHLPAETVSYLAQALPQDGIPSAQDCLQRLSACPQIGVLREALRARIFGRTGFAVVRGMPPDWLHDSRHRLAYEIVCSLIGSLDYQKGPFYEVYDRGAETYTASTRYSDTHFSHGFHTDSTVRENLPAAIGLLCVRQSSQGGENRLSNAANAWENIAAADSRALAPLTLDICRDRDAKTGGDHAEATRKNAYPVYAPHARHGMAFRYMRRWVDQACAKLAEPLAPASRQALDMLDTQLENTAHTVTYKTSAGEMLLVNNLHIAHDRAAFTDQKEKRIVLRAWMYDHE